MPTDVASRPLFFHPELTLQAAKNSRQQIPHRLKPVRDEKNKGLVTAHLKVRPFKTYRTHLVSATCLVERDLLFVSQLLTASGYPADEILQTSRFSFSPNQHQPRLCHHT
jgi:hypothetical protein